MTPVVNGLAEEYAGRVDFRVLNAGSGEGRRAFNAYALPGHPGYIVLDPSGTVLWVGFGPQTVEALRRAIDDALASMGSLSESASSTAEGVSIPATVDVPPLVSGGELIQIEPLPTLDPVSVSRGEQVYQQYCAGCHGENLEGQPDWQQPLPDGSFRAPPHDSSGHTWHHSDDVLLEIIAEGGDPEFGGTMPGFGDLIDMADQRAVLEFIKSYWGPGEREIQWRASNRAP